MMAKTGGTLPPRGGDVPEPLLQQLAQHRGQPCLRGGMSARGWVLQRCGGMDRVDALRDGVRDANVCPTM